MRQLLTKPAFLFFLLVASVGLHTLFFSEKPTDSVSERIVLNDANDIVTGNHKWGIGLTNKYCQCTHYFVYTHYPNGPAYILTPFILLGIKDSTHLRLVPIFLSALAFSFLYYSILKSQKSFITKLAFTFIFVLLLYQPGIRNWLKALHEHAYWVALASFTPALIILNKNSFSISLLLGFIIGWIGYDFIPGLMLAIFTLIWVKQSFTTNSNLLVAVKPAIKKFFPFIFGLLLAIILHLIQNSLYYGSLIDAYNDLFGSLFVRMGIQDWGSELNPTYYNNIVNAFKGNMIQSRWKNLSRFFDFSPRLTFNLPSIFITSLLLLFLVISKFIQLSKQHRLTLLIGLFFAGFSGIIWHLAVPWHAHFHFYFTYRNLFISYFATIAILNLRTKHK